MNPFIQPGAFSWCELLTSDPEAAKSFYSQVFGWTLKQGDVSHVPYTVIEVNGREIGGIGPLPANSPDMSPTWGVYVTVADVDQTLEQVQTLGGKVLMPPIQVPPAGRFALIQDPQGATLAVISYASPPNGVA